MKIDKRMDPWALCRRCSLAPESSFTRMRTLSLFAAAFGCGEALRGFSCGERLPGLVLKVDLVTISRAARDLVFLTKSYKIQQNPRKSMKILQNPTES